MKCSMLRWEATMKRERNQALLDEVLDRCSIGDCWIWQGAHTADGYGLKWNSDARKSQYTHRIVWEQLVGQIPPGLVIDHLCRVRDCVNPDHLRTLTMLDNIAASPIDRNTKECHAGHIRTEETTLVRPDGTRSCRPCQAARSRAFRTRHNG